MPGGLRDRLVRLRQQPGLEAQAPVRDRLARLGRQSPGGASPPDDARVADLAGGVVLGEGLVLVERRLALPGIAGLSTALQALPTRIRHGGDAWVVVDTETTGLAGGTGTLVFQLGMARPEGDGLCVRQWLLTRIGAEADMLQAADAWAGDAGLISYNGKCFDVPLLATRCRLARVDAGWLERPHADLLHPVRRAFGRQWPDCRLASVEHRLLGQPRTGDLPGAEAPQAWLDYVRRGATENLLRVLDHNRQDLVSLASLVPALAAVYLAPARYGADVAAVARAWEQAGDPERAIAVLAEAGPGEAPALRHQLGHLLKRQGDWEAACRLWEALAADGDALAVEHLAKYYEHVRRDYPTAMTWARRLPPRDTTDRRLDRLAARVQDDLYSK